MNGQKTNEQVDKCLAFSASNVMRTFTVDIKRQSIPSCPRRYELVDVECGALVAATSVGITCTDGP